MLHSNRMKNAAATRVADIRQLLMASIFGKSVLFRSSEFMDEFLRFLHSVFVEGRADQDLFLSQLQVRIDPPLREIQRKRQVGLDLFLEKCDYVPPGLIHRSPPALRELLTLNASKKHKNYDDDENDPQASRRSVAPISAVIPSRQRAEERQDQKDN